VRKLPIETVILARGSEANPELCDRVLAAFPNARVERQPDAPPARVRLEPPNGGDQREAGKRTLVLGSIGRVLDVNREPGMGDRVVCYPYQHFSAVGNCPYDCKFCYLSGNRGNLKCPAIKLYTNLGDVLLAIGRVADRAAGVELFYGSKLQDFVALDSITRYSETLVPFAAEHPNVRLLFLTKSADIETFLPLDHRGHTILSWTLNAEPVIAEYEVGAPSLDERLQAARRAANAGYEVRLIFMPMVPVAGWRDAYEEAVRKALRAVRPSRVTVGGICMYRSALAAMRRRLAKGTEAFPLTSRGNASVPFATLHPPAFPGDRYRYRPEVRTELYAHMLACIREADGSVPVSLCLETPDVWEGVGLRPADAPCNCLL
jgi:spore photoproduct lyase